MAEHERATQNRHKEVDKKHRQKQRESKPLFKRLYAWNQGILSMAETPFLPRMDEHAELLAMAPSDEHRYNLVMRLQQTYGNSYVQRLLNSRVVQAKLTINTPNDIYEQEADRVAKTVTKAAGSPAQSKSPEEKELLRTKVAIQRMPNDEVESLFESFASWEGKPNSKVIDKIAELTEPYENERKITEIQFKRKQEVRNQLTYLINVCIDKVYGGVYKFEHLNKDVSFWEKEVGEMIEKLRPEGPTEEEIENKVIQNQDSEKVSLGERLLMDLTMGQGISADLRKYILFSSAFSTCSPVVMFNAKSFRGGLFHYGAGANVQLSQIEGMFDDINPDKVELDERAQKEEDLMAFLKKRGWDKEKIKTIGGSNVYFVYLDKGYNLAVESLIPQAGLWVNVTVMKKQPKYFEKGGIKLFFNKDVYKDTFAKEKQ